MFDFFKKHLNWFWLTLLITPTVFIFLTIFPEVTLPPVIYYLTDDLLIPKIVESMLKLAELYSYLLLWIVDITPPFPDVFNWIDILFSIKFQKQVTYFICHTIPSLTDLWNYFLNTHDFMCSLVEALLLLYISVKVFLTWFLIYVWPPLTAFIYWYKQMFFSYDPIHELIKNEGTLFFKWLLLYQTYSSTSKRLQLNDFNFGTYNFSLRRWSALWISFSIRSKWSDGVTLINSPTPLLVFFQSNRLTALRFLIFISCSKNLNLFQVSFADIDSKKLLIIKTSPLTLTELKIHRRDLDILENDNFLSFTLKNLVVCYLLKLKF